MSVFNFSNLLMRGISIKERKYLPGFFFIFLSEVLLLFVAYSSFPVEVTKSIANLQPELVVLLVICFFLFFLQKGLIGEVGGLFLVTVVFALVLNYRWNAGYYDGNILGGLLPFSDAADYYADAQRLILGESFTTFATRRPLFTGLFAFLLTLTQMDLRLTLALMVGVNAIAAFLAAREVRSSHGPLAASFMLILEIIFFHAYIGKILTENLGFALGALAFAMLWRGARFDSMKLIWAGLFTISMALSARAGAFFVIPAILSWGFFYYRTHGSRWKKFLAGGISAIAISFIIDFFLVKVLGSTSGAAFSNYPYSFYGLAVGYKGWNQVNIDFPGIQESQVLGVAIRQVLSHPGMLFIGMGRAFLDYLFPNYGAFSFTPLVFNNLSSALSNTVLWSSTIFGAWLCFKQRTKPLPSLALWLWFGVLFSVPLVPPIDSDQMRIYAATIPISAALAAIAFGFLHMEGYSSGNTQECVPISPWVVIFSGLLLVSSSLGPIIIKEIGKPIEITPLNCPESQEWVSVITSPNSIVSIVPDNKSNEIPVVEIQRDNFLTSTIQGRSSYTELTHALSSMVAGQSIVTALNLADKVKTGQYGPYMYLIGNSEQMASGIINGCATSTTSSWLKNYHFFYLSSIELNSNGKEEMRKNSLIPDIGSWLTGGILIGLILFTLLTLINVPGTSLWVKILQLVSLLAIISSCGYLLQKQAIFPLLWEKQALNPAEFVPITGNSFGLRMNTKWMSQPHLDQSPAVLLEDGIKLSLPNAMHQDIINIGKGRFSLWDGYLYFSSSDNSDPRLNHREYTLFWPKPFSKKYDFYFLLAFLFGVMGILYSFSSEKFWFCRLNTWRNFFLVEGRQKLLGSFLSGLQGLGLVLIFTSLLLAQLGLDLTPGWGWKRVIALLLGIILFFGEPFFKKILPKDDTVRIGKD